MDDAPAPVRALYDAMADHDGHAIRAALHPEFVGEVTDGMPLGTGGTHAGPDAMLAEVWGPVFVHFDVRVEPQECLTVGRDEAVVLGRYRGSGRATGTRLDAVFAHVFELRDGRVARLRQITDSAAWRRAAGTTPAAPVP